MFNRLFGKPKEQANASALATLDKLNETLDMLEKKEKVLEKKAAAELERAKEFSKAKNKRAAIQSLKRKKLYEQQIEQLGNFQLRIHDQMIMLEAAKATTETVDALRTGAAAMKAMQKATNIDDVDKTMDEINEQTENMKQIQDALSAPLGASADFDERQNWKNWREQNWNLSFSSLLQPHLCIQCRSQAPGYQLALLRRKHQLRRMSLQPCKLKWHCDQQSKRDAASVQYSSVLF
uniref:Charged multivesicular body protein 4b n=1 Tax=Oryza meridionalis TaxID=40149 RepID=A0A0E0EQ15_9ORYZ